MLNLEDLTDYKIVYIGILDDPGNGCKLLILMVGERGFEPPTPWSRTRCSTRLSHSPIVPIFSCSFGMENALQVGMWSCDFFKAQILSLAGCVNEPGAVPIEPHTSTTPD